MIGQPSAAAKAKVFKPTEISAEQKMDES